MSDRKEHFYLGYADAPKTTLNDRGGICRLIESLQKYSRVSVNAADSPSQKSIVVTCPSTSAERIDAYLYGIARLYQLEYERGEHEGHYLLDPRFEPELIQDSDSQL